MRTSFKQPYVIFCLLIIGIFITMPVYAVNLSEKIQLRPILQSSKTFYDFQEDGKILKKKIKSILLINAASRGRGRDVRPPFSLYSLYMSLKREFGNEIQIEVLDCAIQEKGFKIKDYLVSKKPDLVGISTSCSFYSDIAVELAKEARKVLPESIICSGGIHASVVPREVIQIE
ncbi:MAG: cobalamin-dependent protein, partial [Planctomycetota bacterium]